MTKSRTLAERLRIAAEIVKKWSERCGHHQQQVSFDEDETAPANAIRLSFALGQYPPDHPNYCGIDPVERLLTTIAVELTPGLSELARQRFDKVAKDAARLDSAMKCAVEKLEQATEEFKAKSNTEMSDEERMYHEDYLEVQCYWGWCGEQSDAIGSAHSLIDCLEQLAASTKAKSAVVEQPPDLTHRDEHEERTATQQDLLDALYEMGAVSLESLKALPNKERPTAERLSLRAVGRGVDGHIKGVLRTMVQLRWIDNGYRHKPKVAGYFLTTKGRKLVSKLDGQD